MQDIFNGIHEYDERIQNAKDKQYRLIERFHIGDTVYPFWLQNFIVYGTVIDIDTVARKIICDFNGVRRQFCPEDLMLVNPVLSRKTAESKTASSGKIRISSSDDLFRKCCDSLIQYIFNDVLYISMDAEVTLDEESNAVIKCSDDFDVEPLIKDINSKKDGFFDEFSNCVREAFEDLIDDKCFDDYVNEVMKEESCPFDKARDIASEKICMISQGFGNFGPENLDIKIYYDGGKEEIRKKAFDYWGNLDKSLLPGFYAGCRNHTASADDFGVRPYIDEKSEDIPQQKKNTCSHPEKIKCYNEKKGIFDYVCVSCGRHFEKDDAGKNITAGNSYNKREYDSELEKLDDVTDVHKMNDDNRENHNLDRKEYRFFVILPNCKVESGWKTKNEADAHVLDLRELNMISKVYERKRIPKGIDLSDEENWYHSNLTFKKEANVGFNRKMVARISRGIYEKLI